MTTEITKLTDCPPARGWLLYDDQCRICVGLAHRLAPILGKRGFLLKPMEKYFGCRPPLRGGGGERRVAESAYSTPTGRDEMCVLTTGGKLFGGADAVVFLAHHIWWAWPLAAVAELPGAMSVLRRAYRWVAEHRRCVGGACAARTRSATAATAEGLLDDLLD